jgi:uncharacterized glyoxalase superfamily protein PhnB
MDRKNPEATVSVRKITPLLYVEAIEPVLEFWTERLGFEVVAEVPEGDRLGFVLLQRDGSEVMYQARVSVEKDMPVLADHAMGGTMLYIEVEDLDDVERRLHGVERLVPRRTTFYGAQEIVVREPAGNVVAFSQFDRP